MRQLTGLDASFLYLETANSPMHISGLSIYDQSTAPGGMVRFKDIVENTNARMQELPVMTQRLVTVPLNLDHPYWVTDGAYDPEFHIRHLALPRPGDWRQLCILVSRLQSRPLDRAHPLWELYIIEGLDNVEGVPKGSFAMFHKTHHAAIDGTSGMELTAAIHDLSANYARAPKAATISVDDEPSALEMLLRAQYNTLRKPFHLFSVARNTVPGLARAMAGVSRGRLSRVKEVPRTRFNSNVSPHRVFDAINVPLDDVKKIKNAVPGATVNDAAIAIVGGALRKYLQAHDELPAQSLAAMTPINVRSDKDQAGGNIIASMTVQVRSDIEAPLARLQAVHESSRRAKELTHAIGAKTMTDYSQFIPAMLTAQAARLASRWGLMNRINPLFNCVITNVPGPPISLYNTGARMVANYGTGPVMDGVGLFHVIGSYCGQFVISATSCRRMMPDPAFYRQCLHDSVEELRAAAVEGETVTPVGKAAAKRSAKKRKRTSTQATPRRKKSGVAV
jgi:diacylglycerol O-acyltransferase